MLFSLNKFKFVKTYIYKHNFFSKTRDYVLSRNYKIWLKKVKPVLFVKKFVFFRQYFLIYFLKFLFNNAPLKFLLLLKWYNFLIWFVCQYKKLIMKQYKYNFILSANLKNYNVVKTQCLFRKKCFYLQNVIKKNQKKKWFCKSLNKFLIKRLFLFKQANKKFFVKNDVKFSLVRKWLKTQRVNYKFLHLPKAFPLLFFSAKCKFQSKLFVLQVPSRASRFLHRKDTPWKRKTRQKEGLFRFLFKYFYWHKLTKKHNVRSYIKYVFIFRYSKLNCRYLGKRFKAIKRLSLKDFTNRVKYYTLVIDKSPFKKKILVKYNIFYFMSQELKSKLLFPAKRKNKIIRNLNKITNTNTLKVVKNNAKARVSKKKVFNAKRRKTLPYWRKRLKKSKFKRRKPRFSKVVKKDIKLKKKLNFRRFYYTRLYLYHQIFSPNVRSQLKIYKRFRLTLFFGFERIILLLQLWDVCVCFNTIFIPYNFLIFFNYFLVRLKFYFNKKHLFLLNNFFFFFFRYLRYVFMPSFGLFNLKVSYAYMFDVQLYVCERLHILLCILILLRLFSKWFLEINFYEFWVFSSFFLLQQTIFNICTLTKFSILVNLQKSLIFYLNFFLKKEKLFAKFLTFNFFFFIDKINVIKINWRSFKPVMPCLLNDVNIVSKSLFYTFFLSVKFYFQFLIYDWFVSHSYWLQYLTKLRFNFLKQKLFTFFPINVKKRLLSRKRKYKYKYKYNLKLKKRKYLFNTVVRCWKRVKKNIKKKKLYVIRNQLNIWLKLLKQKNLKNKTFKIVKLKKIIKNNLWKNVPGKIKILLFKKKKLLKPIFAKRVILPTIIKLPPKKFLFKKRYTKKNKKKYKKQKKLLSRTFLPKYWRVSKHVVYLNKVNKNKYKSLYFLCYCQFWFKLHLFYSKFLKNNLKPLKKFLNFQLTWVKNRYFTKTKKIFYTKLNYRKKKILNTFNNAQKNWWFFNPYMSKKLNCQRLLFLKQKYQQSSWFFSYLYIRRWFLRVLINKVVKVLRTRLFGIQLKVVYKNYFLFITRDRNKRLLKVCTPYFFTKRPWYYHRLFSSITTVVKKTVRYLTRFRLKFYRLNYICNRFYYQQKALQVGLDNSKFFCVVVKRYVNFAHNGLRAPKKRRK